MVAFNRNFARIEIDIDIKARCEHLCFKVLERIFLDEDRIQQITVVEEKSRVRKYLRAQGEVQGKKETSVAVPLESNGDGSVCLRVGETPRLFKDIPLVGTESFSFPAVINSFKFSPTEDRNEVRLGQSHTPANIKNQAVIEEACGLLVHLLGHAASERWHHAHQWAEIPPIEHPVEQTRSWLRKCIKEKLIEKIRQTPVIVTEAGKAIASKDATLPLAKTDDGVKALWDLLDGWQGHHEVLPRRSEAIGWWNAVKSWADMHENNPMSLFNEVMNGENLAELIQDKANSVKSLQGFLRDDICAIQWLDRFYDFLRQDGCYEVVRTYTIIPNQEGGLDKLSNLHRDRGIDKELKDIAELLGWPVRPKLRDEGISSLAAEIGREDWDSEYVVGELIKKFQERAKENPDDNFEKASVRLFAWIVGQKDWNRLHGFPVFTQESNSDRISVLYLPRAFTDDKPPLAPVGTWPEGLEQFADLFPPDRILADDFFQEVRAPEVWEQLDEQRLIRNSMVITYNEKNLKELSPDLNQEAEDVNQEELTHEAVHCITVTNVVEREAIIDRVRNRPKRAFLFWRFLTEWLIKEHGQGLEMQEALCTCKESHKYYPAAWLMPVRNKSWIRLEGSNTRVRADVQRLANLLQGNEWEFSSLNENPAIIKLLQAMGVERFDLMRKLTAEDDEARAAMDNAFIDMLSMVEGDVNYLNHAREYIEDLKNDENLPNILKKRRKQRERVHENQHLGQLVEELVEENLKREDFSVSRTGIGSDFQISVDSDDEIDTNDVVTLNIDKENIDKDNQRWLVEVKATRDYRVRLTDTQAKKSVKKGDNFLLCVVPLDPGDVSPELDIVRAKMRFVKNIGSRVDRLCNDLEGLEEFREEITASASSGVQLEVVSGAARIRVASSVWENDGFPLENLAEQLK